MKRIMKRRFLNTRFGRPPESLSSRRRGGACARMPRQPSAWLWVAALLTLGLPSARCQYGWTAEDQIGTDTDPWVPCDKSGPSGALVRGFCRLSCTARWSYAHERMDCRQLPWNELLARAHSQGQFAFRQLSQDSFSKVNSGPSDPNDPDTAIS